MDRSGTVVVGVDGSVGSRAALAHALDDAARRGARVRVVAVVPPPDRASAYSSAPRPSPIQVRADVLRMTRRLVAEVVVGGNRARAQVPLQVVALPGRPAEVLLAESAGAAQLVLGHRGRGAVASAVLGSVSLHCLLHATCPVTVVPAGVGDQVAPA